MCKAMKKARDKSQSACWDSLQGLNCILKKLLGDEETVEGGIRWDVAILKIEFRKGCVGIQWRFDLKGAF